MPYAIRNASRELLSPCSLSIAYKSFYLFWDIFESFRLQKNCLRSYVDGNQNNFTTNKCLQFCGMIHNHLHTGFKYYLYSRCCHSFSHCFGLHRHLAHPAAQELAGANCVKRISLPKIHHCCGEERECKIMQVTFPNVLLPSFLVKATTKLN